MKNIDNQFIEALVAQYWGQKCIKVSNCIPLKTLSEYISIAKNWPENVIEYLELRSIDSVTDEEAQEMGWLSNFELIRYLNKFKLITAKLSDDLKNIGVLVPFRGVSIEEMLQSGKVKLKS